MKKEISEITLIKDANDQVRKITNHQKIEFYPDGKEGYVRITVSKEYELKLSDRVVIDMPSSCYECPCGFGSAEDTCGRNIPWTHIDSKERPSTCKLRTLEQYLKEMEEI